VAIDVLLLILLLNVRDLSNFYPSRQLDFTKTWSTNRILDFRVHWPRLCGTAVSVRFRHTSDGHSSPLRVASLRQLRSIIVPEHRELDVRVRPRRFAVHRRIVLPLQETEEVSRRNADVRYQHLSRVLLHMLLFRVHVRADRDRHMVPPEQTVEPPNRAKSVQTINTLESKEILSKTKYIFTSTQGPSCWN